VDFLRLFVSVYFVFFCVLCTELQFSVLPACCYDVCCISYVLRRACAIDVSVLEFNVIKTWMYLNATTCPVVYACSVHS